MGDLGTRLHEVWQEANEIWVAGGWAMWALLVTALVMFGVGVSVQQRLREKRRGRVSEERWRSWIKNPKARRGNVGLLLDAVDGGHSLEDMEALFAQLRLTETRPFQRDLKVMKICVSAAPLVGLLGTVTGMLATFEALAQGAGGDKTMALIASGISEALYTTMTGLVIALPGLFFQYRLSRLFEEYKAFLAHLESVCMQTRQREIEPEVPLPVQEQAQFRIALTLRRALEERIGTTPAGSPA